MFFYRYLLFQMYCNSIKSKKVLINLLDKLYWKCIKKVIQYIREVGGFKMAKTHILHIRVEPKVKEKAEETLNDLGLSISEAVNVFLNQVILNEGIPFEIRKNRYSNSTIKAMEDIKKGKNLSNTFDSVDKMFEELDK